MIFTFCSDIWLSFVPGGEDGKFEPELSSLSNGINVLYLLIWSCFKVLKKVTVTNLAFYKEIGNWTKQSSKVKMSRGLLRGDVEASNWVTHNFFFVPCSWQDEKHLSFFLYWAQNLPSLLFFYLQTLHHRHCWSEQYAGCVLYELRNRARSPWSEKNIVNNSADAWHGAVCVD